MVVTILAPEDRGTFTLGPEAEAALLASIEEADRGEVISGEELFAGAAARLSCPRRAPASTEKVG